MVLSYKEYNSLQLALENLVTSGILSYRSYGIKLDASELSRAT